MVLLDTLQRCTIERLVSMMSGVINVMNQRRTVFSATCIITVTRITTFSVIFLSLNRRGGECWYRYSDSSFLFIRADDFGGNDCTTPYQSGADNDNLYDLRCFHMQYTLVLRLNEPDMASQCVCCIC